VPDPEAAARRGAELLAAAARDAVGAHGSCALAGSGGSDPWRMFELLAELEVPWSVTELFQVDERVAPPGHEHRNLTHLLLALPLDLHGAVRPMPVGDDDLKAAAERYERSLPEALDCVHLGIGPDGHTASLVPGDPVLEVGDRRVAVTANEYEGRRRMTLTYPALDAARRLLWLVTGESKRDALAKLLAGDRSIPAGRVAAQDAVVIADEAAAGS
jgi:6-phosphogluconolactonase